jgi:hypothetical protein
MKILKIWYKEIIKPNTKEETFEKKLNRAKKELAENSITSERRSIHKIGISTVLERGITPENYSIRRKVLRFVPNLIIGGEKFYCHPHVKDFRQQRQDAWRFYLGIPQKNNTFEISDYCLGEEVLSKEKILEEYSYKLNGFWEACYPDREFMGRKRSDDLYCLVDDIQKKGGCVLRLDYIKGVMGYFSFHSGLDKKGYYISYNDVWDINAFPEYNKGFFGKPFRVYDRLYYNNETFEPKL